MFLSAGCKAPARYLTPSRESLAPHRALHLHRLLQLRGDRPARWRPQAGSTSLQSQAPPPSATPQLGDEYFAKDQRPIILFDGVCNMCNGGVNFCLDWDKEGRVRFAALQSNAGRKLLQRSGRRPDDISSIVLVEPRRSYIKAEAVLRIAQQLQAPLPLMAAALGMFPGLLKDAVYDGVAANRYLVFGRTSSCRLSDARFEERFIGDE